MKKEIFKFIVLLLVAAGAGPAGAAFWQWSTTPGANANADPSINWAEGQAPSSVNDSARSMMAVLARWRNDVGGNLQTGGTSTAYTLTTNSGFGSAADMDNSQLTFNVHATNGDNPTLNVDGIGALPITTNISTPVPAGTLLVGSVYEVVFYNSVSKFVLKGLYGSPYNIPLGGILWSTAPTAPNSNFVAPSGQCISTTTYATYWVQQGSPASGACPGGQFAIIDMRGRVPAALDTLNASAAGRLTNSGTGCGTAMTSVGATCSNGVEGRAISLAQLPTGITSSGVNNINVAAPGGLNFITGTGVATANTQTGPNQVTNVLNPVGNASGASGSNSIAVTSNNTSGAATPFVQPTIGLIPYLRIL